MRPISSPTDPATRVRLFDGPHSDDQTLHTFINPLLHSDSAQSVEVTNDPRVFSDNVLSRRLSTLMTVMVSSVLVGSLAFTAIMFISPAPRRDSLSFSYLNLLALMGMVAVLSLNLFCVVVLTQQVYLLIRIMTGGPMGFEVGKSYYVNASVTSIRHFSTSAFIASIPVFMFSAAAMVYQEIAPAGLQRAFAGSVAGIMVFFAALMAFVLYKQKEIFHEKWQALAWYEAPMHDYMSGSVARCTTDQTNRQSL